MTLAELLVGVWQQAMADGLSEITVGDRRAPIGRTRSKGLRIVAFEYEGHPIEGIEQNPETSSRWAKLAQEGQRIMQFSSRHRYFANVCEGKLLRYPAWGALGLPE